MQNKRLQVDFDPDIEGIGSPPKLIKYLESEYGKILKLEFPGNIVLSDRLIPVPAHFHGSSKLILPSEWKTLYSITSDYAICNVIEPDFAHSITISPVTEEKTKQIPPIQDVIEDKSVLFINKYIRFTNDRIYQIKSIGKDYKISIANSDTIIDPTSDKDDTDGKSITVSQMSDHFEENDSSIENGSSSNNELQITKVTFSNLNKLKGIDEVINRLKKEVIFPFIEQLNGRNSNPIHTGGVLLYGPPGTGKTEIAHAVAKDLKIKFYPVKIGELASPFVHQFSKNLSMVFKKAAKEKNGALIFLDEFDSYAGKRSGRDTEHERENVNNLLQLLDPKNIPPHVLVIAATNYISKLDSAVIRSGRFDTKIPVFPPDKTGRAQILRQKIQETGVELSDISDAFINEIAYECAGYVGGDLDVLIKKAYSFARIKALEQKTSVILEKSHIKEAKETILPLCHTEMDIKKPTLRKTDLPGSEDFIDAICQEITFLLNPDNFRKDLNYNPDQGFLLYGPPGTGKTSIANAIANELGLLFKVIDSNELVGKYYGESGSNVRSLFEQARLFRPILLFFDEIDSIATSRNDTSHSFQNESLYALLNEIDSGSNNDKVIVIGATNRRNAVDPALLRPGRLTQQFEVAPPEFDQIKLIVKKKLEAIPHTLKEKDIESLSELIHDRSSATAGKKALAQTDIARIFNLVTRHLVLHTKTGDKADLNLFKTILAE